jgi:hypothetical protein
MDIADNMEQVSGHESSFKTDTIFVGFENTFGPAQSVQGVNVLLELSHRFEHVFRVVNDVGEMVLIKHLDTIFLDVISPNSSLNECLGSAIGQIVKGGD